MESSPEHDVPRRQSGAIAVFITSFSAAVCVAGGFAIVLMAFMVAAGYLFSRSWHVERRLAAGEEIDEPKLSILDNWRK